MLNWPMKRMKRACALATAGALLVAATGCGGATPAGGEQPLCRQSQASPVYRQAIAADRPLLRRLKQGLRAA